MFASVACKIECPLLGLTQIQLPLLGQKYKSDTLVNINDIPR